MDMLTLPDKHNTVQCREIKDLFALAAKPIRTTRQKLTFPLVSKARSNEFTYCMSVPYFCEDK